jgi:hypothetical protein
MPDAICEPGQNEVPAVAPREVTLALASGTFPGSPDWVRIFSNTTQDDRQLEDLVPTERAIKGRLPVNGPGNAQAGETFKIKAMFGEGTSSETVYVADPVQVFGAPGTSGYPPTMSPGSQAQPAEDLQHQT